MTLLTILIRKLLTVDSKSPFHNAANDVVIGVVRVVLPKLIVGRNNDSMLIIHWNQRKW